MNHVLNFHMHTIDGGATVPIPGAVYDCDDAQCTVSRKVIRGMAEWPKDSLDAHILSYEDRVNRALDTLNDLRDARELKMRDAK